MALSLSWGRSASSATSASTLHASSFSRYTKRAETGENTVRVGAEVTSERRAFVERERLMQAIELVTSPARAFAAVRPSLLLDSIEIQNEFALSGICAKGAAMRRHNFCDNREAQTSTVGACVIGALPASREFR